MWASIATIMGVCGAIGVILDLFFLGRSHRATIHHRVSVWWESLRVTPVPNLPAKSAEGILRYLPPVVSRGDTAIDRRWVIGWSTIIVTSLTSLLLTTAALLIGTYLFDRVSSWRGAWDMYTGFYQITIPYLIINLFFDLATIAVTLHILTYVLSARPVKSMGLILLDFVFAILLAVSVQVLSDIAGNTVIGRPINALNSLENSFTGLMWLVAPNSSFANKNTVIDFLYCATALIPTSAFLLLVFLAVPAKFIGDVGHWTAVHALGVAKEKEPESLPAGTMSMMLIALALSVAAVIWEVFTVLRNVW